MRKVRLLFHTTDGQSFYKVTLEEWIEDSDWNCCHHHHGHPSSFLRKGLDCTSDLARCTDGFRDVIHIILDLHQQVLKGIEVFTLDIEESVEPVIPEGEGCEETDGSNPWERKWQTDLEEDPCLTGSIYPSRLKNGFWDRPFEEGPHQDNVKRTQ